MAARFGAISFDNGNAMPLWIGQLPTGQRNSSTHRAGGLPSAEELLAEQCRMVKEVNPETRCLVYRNGGLGLQWFSSQAAEMYRGTAASERLFLRRRRPAADETDPCDPTAPAGSSYCEAAPQDWPNGTVHPPMDLYFYNYSEPAMTAFWNDTVMFGANGMGSPHVDGFFVDDDAFGREHPLLRNNTGMPPAAVADFAAKQRAAFVASWASVIRAGGFIWNTMRDPDGYEARAWGQKGPLNPNAANCSAWMTSKCGRNYDNVTLLMTPQCSKRSGLCDERNASAAAFMLLRGPHAFWGGGFWWGDNAVEQPTLFDERIGNLDPGVPLGACTASADGTRFARRYSKLVVTLDCKRFAGRFDPVAPGPGSA